MISNLSRYKEDLAKLISQGDILLNAMKIECYPESLNNAVKSKTISKKRAEEIKTKLPSFKNKYQGWYSESLNIVKQILPDRLANFIARYEKPKTRKEISWTNYVIEDYLQGLSVTRTSGFQKEKIVGPEAAITQFEQQLNILKSVERRFESSLFDIRQLVQADLFDSELDAAKELCKNNFYRAAGAVSGVVLEKHLRQVAENHNLSLTKKHPTINDYNELLKQNEVIETSQWRFIQLLGDIRNLCDHDKKKEPTLDNINDLIAGVEKITKTLF